MKILFVGFCLVCLSGTRVQSKPQITKLFPVQEAIEYHQRVNNETKPLDKFLGKLRATYNFVFQKPENTSNIEKILAKNASNSDIEALKSIWSNGMQENGQEKLNILNKNERQREIEETDDWVNDIQPIEHLEPLDSLESQDEIENKNHEVEIINPDTSFQFPVTLSRHLVDWLGSLLGITYGVYSKLSNAIHSNNTTININ